MRKLIKPPFKQVALIAAFFCLQGCASVFESRVQDKSLPFVPALPVPRAGVYSIELNLLETIAQVKAKCKISYAMACVLPYTTPCAIYALATDFDGFIVHEVRHCTNGVWHKKLKGID